MDKTTKTSSNNGPDIYRLEETVKASQPTTRSGVPKKHFDFLTHLVYAMLVVIALVFITLVIQYFTASQAAFQNLSNQITVQNEDIKILMQAQKTTDTDKNMQKLLDQMSVLNANIQSLIQLQKNSSVNTK